MALSDNQREHYTDRVDVWNPLGSSGLATKTGSKQILDVTYSEDPSLEDVPCMFLSAKEDNDLIPPTGRSEQDQLDTLDQFFFVAGTDVYDQALIKITTPGHPNEGEFYIVQGGGRERPGRQTVHGGSNYKAVYAKRTNKPSEVA